jgi:hypothetical protein
VLHCHAIQALRLRSYHELLPSKLLLVRVVQKAQAVAFANSSSSKNNKTLNLLVYPMFIINVHHKP